MEYLNCNERKIVDNKKEITKIENKKDMVLNMIMNGELSRTSITYRFECYDKKIKELKDKEKYILDRYKKDLCDIKFVVFDKYKSKIINELIRNVIEQIAIIKRDNIFFKIYFSKENSNVLINGIYEGCNKYLYEVY